MNSTLAKTLLTVAAGALGALALVPQFTPFASAITTFSGLLLGIAHGKRPGDITAADVEQLKAALAKYEGGR
jgi:hypothetical protein